MFVFVVFVFVVVVVMEGSVSSEEGVRHSVSLSGMPSSFVHSGWRLESSTPPLQPPGSASKRNSIREIKSQIKPIRQ